MATQSMSSISTLQDSAELWVADASLFAGGANGAWADADLDDVRTWQDQFLHHLPSHHITCLHNTHTAKFKG